MARYKEKGMRYIDADELYETVTKKYSDIVAGCYPFNIVAYDMARLVKEAPIADVVPTSMVDETTKQFLSLHDKYQEQKVEIEALRSAANSYKMHYENLAREIFEEIEEYAELQIESLNIAEKVDSSGADFFGGGKQAFVLLLDHLAELKKKYTEDENG